MKITEELIREKLTEVLDPELNISIVDLGLIYEVEIRGNEVTITMTLTTIGCPLFGTIEVDIKNKLQELELDQNNIHLNLTFDPPWSIEKLSERARAMIGI